MHDGGDLSPLGLCPLQLDDVLGAELLVRANGEQGVSRVLVQPVNAPPRGASSSPSPGKA